jgi:hypothetical protein
MKLTKDQKRGLLMAVSVVLVTLVREFEWLFMYSSQEDDGWGSIALARHTGPDMDPVLFTKAIRWYWYELGVRVNVSYRPERKLFDIEFVNGEARFTVSEFSWKRAIGGRKEGSEAHAPDAMDDLNILLQCSPEFDTEFEVEAKKYLSSGAPTYEDVAASLYDDFKLKYDAEFDQAELARHVGNFARSLRDESNDIPADLEAELNKKYPGQHAIWKRETKLDVLAFRLRSSSSTIEKERGSIKFLAIDDTFCVS